MQPQSDTPASPRRRIWIDTDIAAGVKDRDVDDGLALIQAFHSPEIEIVGVSTVFGNVPHETAHPIARDLLTRFGPRHLEPWPGATGPADLDLSTPAVEALARALKQGPLTILALGPVTNIAGLFHLHPELAREGVLEIVAVAGRRPGQRFTTGETNPRGHRDFNFEQDPKAFQRILDESVPLTLAPFEISSKLWIREDDLARLEKGGPAARWIATPARAWLKLWKESFGVDGFNPFDTLAVAVVTSPQWIEYETMGAEIQELDDDVTEPRMQGGSTATKPFLICSREQLKKSKRVRYCYHADTALKEDLLCRIERSE